MLTIAQEMNLSETAFVRASSVADFGARYFTPQGELPFAGHPTVAVLRALVDAGLVKTDSANVKVSLELPAGVIPIEVNGNAETTQVTMSQLAPEFLQTYDRKEICKIYGLSSDDLIADVPIQTVSTGSPVLMIPVSSQEVLRKIQYADTDAYLKLKSEGDFLFAHHFCLKGATSRGRTFARSLATPPPGGLEDPFTGSATGCTAAYLGKYRLVPEERFTAEQGHWMGEDLAPGMERVGRA